MNANVDFGTFARFWLGCLEMNPPPLQTNSLVYTVALSAPGFINVRACLFVSVLVPFVISGPRILPFALMQ